MERRSLFRPLAIVVATFGVIWAVTIFSWRTSNRVPNGVDIVLYMVALPIALLLAYAILRAVIEAIKLRAKPAATTAVASTEASETQPSDPALAYRMPVLASHVLFAAGNTPSALIEAARSKQRAELHPKWRDASSAQVFAAPVEDVDLEGVTHTLPEAMQTWPESRRRALCLAENLATKMLAEHFDTLLAAQPPSDPKRAPAPPATIIHLEWLLPASWSDDDRHAAQAWLTARLAKQQWQTPHVQIAARAVDSGMAVLKRIDELNVQFNRHPESAHCLLLASDSHMDETTIIEWDNSRQLHGANRVEGRVPGEGASAVLLGAQRDEGGNASVLLHRVVAGQLTKPIDAPGKPQDEALRDLVEQSLVRADIAATTLTHIVSDTDMRASRYAESLRLAEHATPENDPAAAVLPLGAANGDCGAAMALATIAVAASLTAETQQACLVLSHHDARARAVALVSPSAVPDASAAASSIPSLA